MSSTHFSRNLPYSVANVVAGGRSVLTRGDDMPYRPTWVVGALSGVEMNSHQPRVVSHTPVDEGLRLCILVKGRKHPSLIDT